MGSTISVWSKRTTPDRAALLESALFAEGFTGIVISSLPGSSRVEISVYANSAPEARDLQRRFGGSVAKLTPASWEAGGTGLSHPPILIRDRLVISASTEPAELNRLRRRHPGRGILAIPPAMAFGTGDHATTATCLRLLADAARGLRGEPWSFLDLGTGSGILGIAAAMLGAAPVVGMDFDEDAVRIASANAARHTLPTTPSFSVADVLDWKPPAPKWDVIAANLFAGLLVQSFSRMRDWLAPDGVLLISGMLVSQKDECLRAARNCGLEVDHAVQRGRWVTARLRHRQR